MKAFIRSAARADIQRQFRYYLVAQDAPDVAMRFLDAVEGAIRTIERKPAVGSPRFFGNLPGLRSWPIPGFEDIRVYYLHSPEALRILRVLHGHRDLERILPKENSSID